MHSGHLKGIKKADVATVAGGQPKEHLKSRHLKQKNVNLKPLLCGSCLRAIWHKALILMKEWRHFGVRTWQRELPGASPAPRRLKRDSV